MPDALIIQDTTLLQQTDVFAGLADDGYIVINSTRDVPELGIGEMLAGRDPARVITVPATRIAMQHLGRPLPNLVLLGAFAALTGPRWTGGCASGGRGTVPGAVLGEIAPRRARPTTL